jgi:hypothetical protein
MSCKISLADIARRLQFRSYQGAASIVIGGSTSEYAYTLSDTVPLDKYWAVIYAAGIIVGGAAGATNRVGLWLCKPGPLPPNNFQPYSSNPNFFAGTTAALLNAPPVAQAFAIRVDELNDSVGNDEYNKGAERVLVRTRKLLVPGGCTLMAYGGAYGTGNGGAVGEQYQLNIGFVEFKNSETPEVDF